MGPKADPYTDAYDPALNTQTAAPVYQELPAQNSAAPTYGAAGGGRTHTVAKKETLYSIARVYYNGDQSRWREIYEANRADIADPNRIRVGQRLVIP